jgi:hypothetical protein
MSASARTSPRNAERLPPDSSRLPMKGKIASRLAVTLMVVLLCGCRALAPSTDHRATYVPATYQGKPFADGHHQTGPQIIPGRIECALYDLGGEGIAYHDTDAINHGSGELNLQPRHQRPEASPVIWGFRASEGVDISYIKDFADLNHPNLFTPAQNQLYIGWAANGEWCNYTVEVQAPGRYRIVALYGNVANDVAFFVDGVTTFSAHLPVATGSMHTWNKSEIGTINFPQAGLHLLTFRYNAGNNFAYFDFVPVSP